MLGLKNYIRLMRPVNSTMMGIAVIAGFLIAHGLTFSDKVLYGIATAFTLTAASMVINDYYDREVDKLNRPDRPIPSGSVSPNEALAYAFMLGGIGLAIAFLTNLTAFILALIFFAIAIAYNTSGKRLGLLGNTMVAVCVAAPIIYGSALIEPIKISALSLILASMVFLSTVGREITKGIADVEGDISRGARTVPIVMGAKKAAYIAALFYLLAVSLSPLPAMLRLVSYFYMPFVSIACAGFIFISASLLRNHSKENADKVKRHAIVCMLIGLVAFITGAVYV